MTAFPARGLIVRDGAIVLRELFSAWIAGGFEPSGDEGEPRRYALLGVRPGDLRAIATQDRVQAQPGLRYVARRA
jgi:hypothetical protein